MELKQRRKVELDLKLSCQLNYLETISTTLLEQIDFVVSNLRILQFSGDI